MKVMFSSERRRYVARVGIFLIAVALIAGMVGCGQPEPEYNPMVATGYQHTVELKSDGTVVAVGYNYDGQCNVSDWTDIVQVSAGGSHTVGLESAGTVIAVGSNGRLQCNVGGWIDITQDAAIENVIWVLESYGESGNFKAVLKYTEITAMLDGARISGSAGCNTYSGDYELKGNNLSITRLSSTEKSCGERINKLEREYLTALRDAESYEIEGEKLRIHCGKQLLVFNVRYNRYRQWDAGGWTYITQVAAGRYHTVGLKSDGTVVAVGDYGGAEPWRPWIIIVAAAVGLVIFFVRRRRAVRTKGC